MGNKERSEEMAKGNFKKQKVCHGENVKVKLRAVYRMKINYG